MFTVLSAFQRYPGMAMLCPLLHSGIVTGEKDMLCFSDMTLLAIFLSFLLEEASSFSGIIRFGRILFLLVHIDFCLTLAG